MSKAQPVSVRVHFDRFPATVKGAFVVRGEDPDPHQVIFKEARVVALGGGEGVQLAMARATLDVAPRRDVFIPFELSVAELEPGWYGLDCELDVDGIPVSFPGGRRFAVAWPRATVRRGSVRVDRDVRLGDRARARVEQIECAADSMKLHLVAIPPDPVSVRLSSDGSRVEILDVDFDGGTGRHKVTAYPLLRAASVLRIELTRGRGRGRPAAIDVKLPGAARRPASDVTAGE